MTDKEAILGITYCNIQSCASVYENRHNSKGITLCTTCEYRNIQSEYPCWAHRLTDIFLDVIPQLDCVKR